MLRNGLTALKQEEPANADASGYFGRRVIITMPLAFEKRKKSKEKSCLPSAFRRRMRAGASEWKDRQRGGSGFAPPRATEAWRVLRVPMCLYKRRMRRLAREREEGRERKSGNGDGGSLLCIIKTRVTSANRGDPQFQRGSTRC